jgi:hypothetical protein
VQQVVGANQTFLVFDGEDVSTTGLLRSMGQGMGPPSAFAACAGPLAQTGGNHDGQARCGPAAVRVFAGGY